MKLKSIPDCSREEYLEILNNKYDENHKYESSFYFGLWCIKDTMREVKQGRFKSILPYTEYPLNELIKDIELHSGDEKYFQEACLKLQEIYNKLLITNLVCVEQLGTREQKTFLKRKSVK